MKSRLTFLFALTVLLSAAAAVFTLTEFSGTLTFVDFINMVTVECIGGQALRDPAGPPCSAGSRVNVRGNVARYAVTATDPRLTGTAAVTMNLNGDGWRPTGPGSGPLWGPISLEVSKGEVWEGFQSGSRTASPEGEVHFASHIVMHGTGGRIQGLKAEFDVVSSGPNYAATASGWILAPAGK